MSTHLAVGAVLADKSPSRNFRWAKQYVYPTVFRRSMKRQ